MSSDIGSNNRFRQTARPALILRTSLARSLAESHWLMTGMHHRAPASWALPEARLTSPDESLELAFRRSRRVRLPLRIVRRGAGRGGSARERPRARRVHPRL